MHKSSIEKYFLFGLISIVVVLTFAIFYPFITVVVLAASFSVILNPIYRWIKKNLTRNIEWLASLVTVILFLVLLCGPLFAIGKIVFSQTQNAYQSLAETTGSNILLDKIDIAINKTLPIGIRFDSHSKIIELFSFLSQNATGFFASTLRSFLMFILMIFSMFYLLKDGDHWKKSLIKFLPLSESNIGEILSKLGKSINNILRGYFLIAIIQGLLVGVGFAIFGIPNATLWGVAAGVASFIPTIGTSIVCIPAILFLYYTGASVQALGLLIWSIVLVGILSNLITPYLISKNKEISSLFILLSILGGVSLMGAVGILIGPLTLSLLYSLVAIYRKESKA